MEMQARQIAQWENESGMMQLDADQSQQARAPAQNSQQVLQQQFHSFQQQSMQQPQQGFTTQTGAGMPIDGARQPLHALHAFEVSNAHDTKRKREFDEAERRNVAARLSTGHPATYQYGYMGTD